MKYFISTLVILFALSTFAEIAPYTETEEFSEWLHVSDFEILINSVPSSKYPAIIQGGALLGDGVAFRVLLTSKPSMSFQHHITYGKTKKEFTKLNNQYTKAGYTLIHCQTVQLMGGLSYQAVWVKNAL